MSMAWPSGGRTDSVAPMATAGSILGNAVLRKEDPGLLKGDNKYFDDLDVPGVTHVVFVRSNVAHARLVSVDTSAAKAMPGVLAVYSGDDLGLAPFMGFPLLPAVFARPIFAKEKVRLVGDIVAAIVATTRTIGADAAEAVVIEYDMLPAVTDAEAAALPGAPLLFEEHGSNVCFATELGADTNPLEGADVVVEERIVSQRLAGVPMEPNGCVMIPNEPVGGITAWVSHQAPFGVRDTLAAVLGMDASKVRAVVPWVGGGFGPKAAVYPEYIVAAAAAMALGKPVKWTEGRSENMVSLVQGRAMVLNAKLGLKKDGTIVGLRAHVVSEGGAYPAIGAFLLIGTQTMSQGTYNIPKIHYSGQCFATNNPTIGAYRGAGRPEATQMLERIMDVAADELGIDPAELRRKNFIDPSQFPLTTQTGAAYDSGDYAMALDAALEASGYAALRQEQAARRAKGDRKLLGIGLSSYVEITAPFGLHSEWGGVTIEEDGSATVRVGTSSHGQGHDTAFSMLVEEVLGIPMDKVTLVQSDTFEIQQGAGTMGSRSLQTAGSAVFTSSNAVFDKAKQLAAHLLEANPEDIVKGVGGVQVAGVPSKALSWAELAKAANDASKRPADMEAGLAHDGLFDEGNATFPFGAHVAVVEVDQDTGKVELLRHVAVDDCGRILNPLLVRGQQHGGIAQGAAQALFEIMQYDDAGNPITGNLMDYAIPSAAELPSFEASNTQTDSPRNPLGAKGIGESGTIGSTPAIHNAVIDAVSHLGVRHIDMPMSAEKVWRAIGGAKVTTAK